MLIREVNLGIRVGAMGHCAELSARKSVLILEVNVSPGLGALNPDG